MEDNKVTETKNEEEDDDVLSLCDLPCATHQSKEQKEKDHNTPLVAVETQQDDSDFIFCSLSKEPEMCAADEVFYQGRILPCRYNTRPASSSDDHFSSGRRISGRSSNSGSSAAASGGEQSKTGFSAIKQRTVRFNARKKPSTWDIFRPGLLISQPAEIDFQDLKNRYHRNSRNCREKKKKMKRRNFLIGGCRCCSSDAVDAVRTKVVVIKRSARDGESEVPVDEQNLLGQKSPKKRLADNPTLEWLNQLSLRAQGP